MKLRPDWKEVWKDEAKRVLNEMGYYLTDGYPDFKVFIVRESVSRKKVGVVRWLSQDWWRAEIGGVEMGGESKEKAVIDAVRGRGYFESTLMVND